MIGTIERDDYLVAPGPYKGPWKRYVSYRLDHDPECGWLFVPTDRRVHRMMGGCPGDVVADLDDSGDTHFFAIPEKALEGKMGAEVLEKRLNKSPDFKGKTRAVKAIVRQLDCLVKNYEDKW